MGLWNNTLLALRENGVDPQEAARKACARIADIGTPTQADWLDLAESAMAAARHAPVQPPVAPQPTPAPVSAAEPVSESTAHQMGFFLGKRVAQGLRDLNPTLDSLAKKTRDLVDGDESPWNAMKRSAAELRKDVRESLGQKPDPTAPFAGLRRATMVTSVLMDRVSDKIGLNARITGVSDKAGDAMKSAVASATERWNAAHHTLRDGLSWFKGKLKEAGRTVKEAPASALRALGESIQGHVIDPVQRIIEDNRAANARLRIAMEAQQMANTIVPHAWDQVTSPVEENFLRNVQEGRFASAATAVLVMAQDASEDPAAMTVFSRSASLLGRTPAGRAALADLAHEVTTHQETAAGLSPTLRETFKKLDGILNVEQATQQVAAQPQINAQAMREQVRSVAPSVAPPVAPALSDERPATVRRDDAAMMMG